MRSVQPDLKASASSQDPVLHSSCCLYLEFEVENITCLPVAIFLSSLIKKTASTLLPGINTTFPGLYNLGQPCD